MTPTAAASLSLVIAYLVGSIPFAYVVVKAAKGIDVRTVGSGNVGATNAGRVLGRRGFVLVFLLDFSKGLVPTVALPLLVTWGTGRPVADLGVLIALATILGHNFPIYLGFRGGKGVATSLGAVFGLDWAASLVATLAFGVTLRASRYVSLSSMVGALAFVVAHLGWVLVVERKNPFDRAHAALSGLSLVLLAMLLFRHRANWARIRDGTEPKVSRTRRSAPSGKAAILVVAAIVAGGSAP